ncbi:MAG: helix-turn-helix domain-containing protein [Candidatus Eremiobacteraeota bacterium]|nr:helix-turn-helix domain-containing protein [Candidatus Eremiobacteraeota bacterium]
MEKDILNVEEAAAFLKTSKPTFYRWLGQGKIKGFKVGREWRFYKSDLVSFMESSDQEKESLKKELRRMDDYFAERLKKKGIQID